MHVLRPLCCSGLHSNVELRGISLNYKHGKEEEEKNSIRMRLSCAFRKKRHSEPWESRGGPLIAERAI